MRQQKWIFSFTLALLAVFAFFTLTAFSGVASALQSITTTPSSTNTLTRSELTLNAIVYRALTQTAQATPSPTNTLTSAQSTINAIVNQALTQTAEAPQSPMNLTLDAAVQQALAGTATMEARTAAAVQEALAATALFEITVDAAVRAALTATASAGPTHTSTPTPSPTSAEPVNTPTPTLTLPPAPPAGSLTIRLLTGPQSDQRFIFIMGDDMGAFTLVDDGSEPETGITAYINFQPGDSEVPSIENGAPHDYVADNGQSYRQRENSPAYGWVREDTLDDPEPTPLNASSETRDRNRVGIEQRLDTIIHLQRRSDTAVPGAWEFAAPEGVYQVTVSVGDQPSYDSLHTINVEGVPAISQFAASEQEEYRAATVIVPVMDGRLTIDARGGTNTKLNYIDIVQLVSASNAETFFNLEAGEYEINATVPDGWTLRGVTCDAENALTDNRVLVTVGDGANVTCTFRITQGDVEDIEEPEAVEEPEATPDENDTETVVEPQVPVMGVIQSNQNVLVREGPGRGFTALSTVGNGTIVEILGEDESGFWLNVRLEDATEGWILAILVRIDE